jgi:D-3-phosphoglycerate dehydrogenase
MIGDRKILIGPSSFGEKDRSPIDLLERSGFRVVDNPYKRKLTKAELAQLLDEDVVGLIAGLETLDREVLSKSKLKCISRVGSGISNIDLAAARELNIAVRSTPDGPTQAVAELTIGTLLSLLRFIPQMNDALHQGEWSKQIGSQLQAKKCLVIGLGRIGRRVAGLLSAFGAEILVYDPFVDTGSGYSKVASLHEGLRQADIVTLHHSGEGCILGTSELELMKEGSILLNASRGSAVDEAALVTSLSEKRIRGAWLDTFSEEPYRGPLAKFSNVILTPHVGSYTLECRKAMEMDSVTNLLSVIG